MGSGRGTSESDEVSRGRRAQEYGFGRDIVLVGASMPLPLENTESSIQRREKVIIMWGAFESYTV